MSSLSHAATNPAGLGRLAILLLEASQGYEIAACQAIAAIFADYHPRIAAELRLAAIIISFGLQPLEALGQAAYPDPSLTRVLRLRRFPVSVSRESRKADRRLLEFQQARRAS
jgi:hypothetical protein